MAIYCTEGERCLYDDRSYWNALPQLAPSVVFHTRIRTGDTFGWEDVSTWDMFAKRKVLIFSLPGAFTPTCSTYQLPNFEKLAPDFYLKGFDDIYCVSVNDSFVMNAWAKKMGISNVKVIPDGSGLFTKYMGMLISKDHDGFGQRSWRYMAVINDGVVEKWWQEPGINNSGSDDDPYIETTPENTIKYLSASK